MSDTPTSDAFYTEAGFRTDGESADFARELERALRTCRAAMDGDGCLAIEYGNLESIAYHLGRGMDNGAISTDALAKFLRAVAFRLSAAKEAIATADTALK